MDTPYILFFNKVRIDTATPQRATTSSFAIHRTHSAPVTPAARAKYVPFRTGNTDFGAQEVQSSNPPGSVLTPRALGADTIEVCPPQHTIENYYNTKKLGTPSSVAVR